MIFKLNYGINENESNKIFIKGGLIKINMVSDN